MTWFLRPLFYDFHNILIEGHGFILMTENVSLTFLEIVIRKLTEYLLYLDV